MTFPWPWHNKFESEDTPLTAQELKLAEENLLKTAEEKIKAAINGVERYVFHTTNVEKAVSAAEYKLLPTPDQLSLTLSRDSLIKLNYYVVSTSPSEPVVSFKLYVDGAPFLNEGAQEVSGTSRNTLATKSTLTGFDSTNGGLKFVEHQQSASGWDSQGMGNGGYLWLAAGAHTIQMRFLANIACEVHERRMVAVAF